MKIEQIAGGLLMLGLAGCGSSTNYHLIFNASSPEKTKVCRLDKGGAEKCDQLGERALEAPGQLTVSVDEPADDVVYGVRYEEHVAQVNDPGAVFDVFAERLGGFATSAISGILRSKSFPDLGAIASNGQLEDVAKAAPPKIARALRARVVPPSPPKTRATAFATAENTNDVKDKKLTPAKEEDRFLINPTPPFPWVVTLEESDLLELETKYSATREQIAAYVLSYCSGKPKSLGRLAKSWQKDALEHVSETPPGVKEVVAALELQPQDALGAISGKSKLDIEERITKKLREADDARKASKDPTGNAAVIHRLYASALANNVLRTCSANLTFLSKQERTNLPEIPAALGALAVLQTKVGSAADLYAKAIQPFITEIAISYAKTLKGVDGKRLTFGSHPLRPGTLNVTLQQEATEPDAQPQVVSSADLTVNSSGWLAVGAGALVTFCNECITKVEEKAVPARAGTAAGRQIEETAESFALDAAIMLHFALFTVTEHQFGVMVGYPFAQTTGTPAAALMGGSYRFTKIGLQGGLGGVLFQGKQLPEASESPINLSTPGNEALTADSVAEGVVRFAGFASLGFSIDALAGF